MSLFTFGMGTMLTNFHMCGLNQIMILMFCIFESLIGTDMNYHFSVDVPLRI